MLTRRSQWLISGSDFNSQVGGRDSRVETNTCGRYGLGRTNAAGEDLSHWMEISNLCWVSSFLITLIEVHGTTKDISHGMK